MSVSARAADFTLSLVPAAGSVGDSEVSAISKSKVTGLDSDLSAINSSIYNLTTAPSTISRDNPGVTTINTLKQVSADYTATTDDETILVSPSTLTTISLPSASTVKGKKYHIMTLSNSFGTVVDPSGAELVCGNSTIKLFGNQDSVTVQSTGSSWIALNGGCKKTAYLTIQSTCTTSPCLIATQSGEFTGVTRHSVGAYILSGSAHAFGSSAVSCSCSSVGDNNQTCSIYGSFTGANVRTNSVTNGLSQDSQIYIMCVGRR